MEMVKVEDGKVVEIGLPNTGTLRNGQTVSGYHLLDKSILIDEGWYDVIDEPPIYNPDTHYLKFKDYELLDDNVALKIYEITEIPEYANNEFEQYKNIVDIMLGVKE